MVAEQQIVAPLILRRCLEAVPALALLSLLAFALLELAPGDPAIATAVHQTGAFPRGEDITEIRRELQLDDHVGLRYLRWTAGVLQGDLGHSNITGEEVSGIVRRYLPPTLLLIGLGMALAWILAFATGIVTSLYTDSWLGRITSGLVALSIALPGFVISILLLMVFAIQWQLLPTGGMTTAGAGVSAGELLPHLVLPVCALGLTLFGWYSWVLDAAIRDTLQQQFVATAVAKGLPRRTVAFRHVVRASLVPFATQIGGSFGTIAAGVFPIEVVFSWPGLGRQAILAARSQDYPVVMALMLVAGLMAILGNLLADIAVALLDPRVRPVKTSRVG